MIVVTRICDLCGVPVNVSTFEMKEWKEPFSQYMDFKCIDCQNRINRKQRQEDEKLLGDLKYA